MSTEELLRWQTRLPEFLDRVVSGLEASCKGLSREGGEKYLAMSEILRHLQTLKGANQ